jgi:hypothetical protein
MECRASAATWLAHRLRVMRATGITAAFLLVTACGTSGADRSRAESAADAPRAGAEGADPAHALFGCLDGDSAVYSDVETDSVSGAALGLRITLWHAGDGIDGATIAAAREPAHSVPIAEVRLAGRDSVFLDMPHERDSADTSTFAGRVVCDSLWGLQQMVRTSPPRDASYRRLR